MFRPDSLILYVSDIDVSTKFYKELLNEEPIETFEDFSVFALSDGFVLGLQSKHAIDPKPQPSFGGMELSFGGAAREEVDVFYQDWTEKGISIAMKPTTLAFGYTFVALDPDGHRLRVCATDTTNIK